MGDMDMVRPFALARISCTAVAERGDPVHYSRFTRQTEIGVPQWTHQDKLVTLLLELAARYPRPPVLFFQTDGDLLVVSRHRDRLADAFGLAIADAALVEDLVDKSRFHRLAVDLGLPVPPTAHARPQTTDVATIDLPFPLMLKPLSRAFPAWMELESEAKAVRVDDRESLRRLWPVLAEAGLEVLLQQLVEGGEDRIESYHVYVDRTGEIAGQFTGRKIRTYPTRYGHSTAIETTRVADVADLGREVVRRLGLRGVAKVDLKRGPDGRLHLLEVNPRFNLWHHLGAVAGVNLPALVYADVVGDPRPAVRPIREHIRWVRPFADRKAARDDGVSMHTWLASAASAEAKYVMRWDDPLPFLIGQLGTRAARRAATVLVRDAGD